MSTETVETVIVGAGCAGLSAAYNLRGREFRIFEKNDRPGGLCRTQNFGGYRFDHGGHMLHFKSPGVKAMVKRLMKDNLCEHTRRAHIFSRNVITDYPFQANTYGLPPEVVRDCIVGFVEALIQAEKNPGRPGNFRDWILYHFGDGIARNFMLPFNEKFWRTPLDRITTEWLGWSVPRPSLKEVVNGALGIQGSRFGYNVSFFYPRRGGIEALVRALARRVRNIELNQEAAEVHPNKRRLILESGEEVPYRRIVSTMPLKELVSRLRPCAGSIRDAARGLRHLSVLCVNLGVKGRRVSNSHWVYFPEKKFSFYRAGFYSNLAQAKGQRQSLVLEITGRPGELDGREEELSLSALRDFAGAGFLGEDHEVEYMGWMKIPFAYVIYDRHRARWVPKILDYLERRDIFSIGRYGRWEYSTMEDALKQGGDAVRGI